MKKLDLVHEDIKYVGKANKETKRFLITAAVAGAKVHKEFLNTCEKWCKDNKAELVILPCRSHAQAFEGQAPIFDSVLDEFFVDGVIVREYKINSNLKIVDAQINPQNLNPQSSLNKFGNGSPKFSVIIAHPSQNAATLASSNVGHPRRVLCTGVCTQPNYRSNTTGRTAEKHHVIGGLIIEVADDKTFFLKQIQSKKNGSFIFDGKDILSKKLIKNCLILGDLHSGLTDETAFKATLEQIKFFNPEKIVLHDFIDNTVTNNHIRSNIFKKAQLSTWKIEDDIKECLRLLTLLRKTAPSAEFIFVESNHGDRLDKYIESGDYAKDFINFKFLHETALLKFANPTKTIYEFLLKIPGKSTFLTRHSDYYYAEHNLALHGDAGLAGKKGSIEVYNRCIGKCVIGHHHAHGINGKAKQVGHLSKPYHGYNNTLNYWTQGNGVLYEDGSYSELIIIEGKWKL